MGAPKSRLLFYAKACRILPPRLGVAGYTRASGRRYERMLNGPIRMLVLLLLKLPTRVSLSKGWHEWVVECTVCVSDAERTRDCLVAVEWLVTDV